MARGLLVSLSTGIADAVADAVVTEVVPFCLEEERYIPLGLSWDGISTEVLSNVVLSFSSMAVEPGDDDNVEDNTSSSSNTKGPPSASSCCFS